MVGLPHNGFNWGPSVPMSLIGFWGTDDPTVPAVGNDADDPTKACEKRGWCYSSSRNTTNLWAQQLQCGSSTTPPGDYASVFSAVQECWHHDGCNMGKQIIGCHFTGGHICNRKFMNDPMLQFMLENPQTTSVDSSGSTIGTNTSSADDMSTTTTSG